MGPFTWTKTADEILERLASYLQRIPGTGRLAAFLRAGIRQVAAPSFVNRNRETRSSTSGDPIPGSCTAMAACVGAADRLP